MDTVNIVFTELLKFCWCKKMFALFFLWRKYNSMLFHQKLHTLRTWKYRLKQSQTATQHWIWKNWKLYLQKYCTSNFQTFFHDFCTACVCVNEIFACTVAICFKNPVKSLNSYQIIVRAYFPMLFYRQFTDNFQKKIVFCSKQFVKHFTARVGNLVRHFTINK
jgi:hypothetical protein